MTRWNERSVLQTGILWYNGCIQFGYLSDRHLRHDGMECAIMPLIRQNRVSAPAAGGFPCDLENQSFI